MKQSSHVRRIQRLVSFSAQLVMICLLIAQPLSAQSDERANVSEARQWNGHDYCFRIDSGWKYETKTAVRFGPGVSVGHQGSAEEKALGRARREAWDELVALIRQEVDGSGGRLSQGAHEVTMEKCRTASPDNAAERYLEHKIKCKVKVVQCFNGAPSAARRRIMEEEDEE
jgi:hypothetical protein